MTIHRFCGSRGLCPQTPSRGLAAPCTPAGLLTVSPRGTPPRPPAYTGVPQVGVGVVGVAVGLKRRKDERRSAETRFFGGTTVFLGLPQLVWPEWGVSVRPHLYLASLWVGTRAGGGVTGGDPR